VAGESDEGGCNTVPMVSVGAIQVRFLDAVPMMPRKMPGEYLDSDRVMEVMAKHSLRKKWEEESLDAVETKWSDWARPCNVGDFRAVHVSEEGDAKTHTGAVGIGQRGAPKTPTAQVD